MKALVRRSLEAEQFFYEEVPKPAYNENEALIQIKAIGVCGTDYHMWTGGIVTIIPVIPGHEFSGVVEAVGAGVTSVKPGDRVVSRLNINVCGTCKACLTGNPQSCAQRKIPGSTRDGIYAEYIAIDAKQLIKLEDSVPFEEGAIVEPMAIVAHALLERAKVEPEDTVVVFGPGPVGLIAIQMARANGAARIIAVGTDVDEAIRLPLASKLGTDLILNAQKHDIEAVIAEVTEGKGADLVIEASGSEAAINTGIRILRKEGRMCVIGLPSKSQNNVRWLSAVEKSLNLVLSYSSSPWSWNIAISLLTRKAIDVASLITHRYPLTNFREMFDKIRQGEVVKGIFLP